MVKTKKCFITFAWIFCIVFIFEGLIFAIVRLAKPQTAETLHLSDVKNISEIDLSQESDFSDDKYHFEELHILERYAYVTSNTKRSSSDYVDDKVEYFVNSFQGADLEFVCYTVMFYDATSTAYVTSLHVPESVDNKDALFYDAGEKVSAFVNVNKMTPYSDGEYKEQLEELKQSSLSENASKENARKADIKLFYICETQEEYEKYVEDYVSGENNAMFFGGSFMVVTGSVGIFFLVRFKRKNKTQMMREQTPTE